ncbi:MAG TPA: pyridoxamine 5'-phosphate oxidase family protein [Actinomycetes bacterium]
MVSAVPIGEVDDRFSETIAEPTPWSEAVRVLANAELYWLSTVRADGRPHVTPLIGVWQDEAVHFCTGLREVEARNLEHGQHVAVTTGRNIWARGLDLVVEGVAVRVTDPGMLHRLADGYEAKYGTGWRVDAGDGVLRAGEDAAAVFRVDAEQVLAFAKQPHAQTSFRFAHR